MNNHMNAQEAGFESLTLGMEDALKLSNDNLHLMTKYTTGISCSLYDRNTYNISSF